MDPETLAQLFASMGMQPPGQDVLGANAMEGDPNATPSPYGGLGEFLSPGRPTGAGPGQSMEPSGSVPPATPPGYSGAPPAPQPPVSGPPAAVPSGVVSGITNAISSAVPSMSSITSALPSATSLPNIIRAPLGLGTSALPSQDPGGLQGEAGRPQPTGQLTLPSQDPGFDPNSIGNQLNPTVAPDGTPLPRPRPDNLGQQSAASSQKRGGGKPSAASATKGNPLLDMLKAIPKPSQPDVQKVSTPHAPTPSRAGIPGGGLMELIGALNASQGAAGGLRLPPTLLQALGR